MEVYDRAERKVGTVKHVYLGNSSAAARDRGVAPATPGPSGDGDDSLIEDLYRSAGETHMVRAGGHVDPIGASV